MNPAAGRSAVVLGMHRSGTSVVTRVINLLGLPLCRTEDLYTADDNPGGHWESASLIELNDRILRAFGGDVSAPPDFPPCWERSSVALREEARAAFVRAHPTRTWVWKDPRACLTLPLWLEVFSEEPAIVIVARNPLETAASLSQRNGFPLALSIALWERYTREALRSSAGRRVVTIAYERLLERPETQISLLAEGLSSLGVALHGSRVEARSAVSSTARRNVASDALHGSTPLNPRQRDLYRFVNELVAEQVIAWVATDVPEESGTTTRLLEARRRTMNRDTRNRPRRLAARGIDVIARTVRQRNSHR